MRTLIRWAGDDPSREGLADTPRRVVKAYEQLFEGYGKDPSQSLGRVFAEIGGYDDLVLVRDIPFFSHCEHHMVPFFGKAHVGYMPRAARWVSQSSRASSTSSRAACRPRRRVAEIVGAIDAALKPRGVALMLEAEHMCMTMRGVRRPAPRP